MLEEPGELGAYVLACADYVSIDTRYLDDANAPQDALVYEIISNVLAYIVNDDQNAFVSTLKVAADDIWILETTLRWAEDNLELSDDIRDRIRRFRSYISEHHARHAR